jgi:2-methylcitrate dehydratase
MISEQLAEYAFNLRYEDLSEKTAHQVKRHFIDALGCAIGAKEEKPVQIIKKTFAKRDASENALLYGAMIRYFDYNDTYLSKEPAHPADNFGGVLAAAELMNSSTKDFIVAAALGYEIQCRFCDMASLRKDGWDHVIYGAISQALAVGKLLGLNKEQLAQAVNINLSTNISSRQVREASELSMWKALAFSNVARNAVVASILAKQGMTGPNEVFEGKYGIMKMLTGKFNFSLDKFGKKGGHFKILDCWLKNWPAEIHSQSVIHGALELKKEIKDLGKIKRIEVQTHEAGYTIIGSGKEKWIPSTRETADHSIPYLVGAALHHGNISSQVFSQDALKSKEVLKTVAKVTVKEDKRLTKMYPGAAPNRIKIFLTDGNKLEKEVLHHRGHSKNMMTDSEVEEKFNRLTGKYLPEQKRREILEKVWKIESFDFGILGKI